MDTQQSADSGTRRANRFLQARLSSPALPQPTPPTPIDPPADSNIELTWQVFAGEAQELYLALLKERCERDGLGTSEEVLRRQFRLHRHRGIRYLATPHAIRSIADLVQLAGGDEPDKPPSEGQ